MVNVLQPFLVTGRTGCERGIEMTRLAKISFAAVLLAGVALAEPSTTWSEQWFKAKFGQSSPAEQARLKAEMQNTAYREETSADNATAPSSWADQWFRAKYGRYSPAEEARRNAEAANTAYRDNERSTAPDRNVWTREFIKAKFGRDLGNR
jgi:hypothetical protein